MIIRQKWLLISVVPENYILKYAIRSRHQKYSKKFEMKRIVSGQYDNMWFDDNMKIDAIKRRY